MKKLLLSLTLIFTLSAPTLFAQEVDSDNDGLTDKQETTVYFSDPNKADTDGDSYDDKTEVDSWHSPLVPDKLFKKVDTDKDDLDDEFEIKIGTNLNDPDSDDDGYWDGLEVARGYDPLSAKKTKIKKLIKVDIKTQKLAYYFGDVKLDEFAISSGVKGMETPKGGFKILDKVGSKNYGGADFSYPDTKWNLHFTTKKYRYYIHGAYWHNKFGQPMSHGCINVAYKDMERLYYWSQEGTEVQIS